MASLYRKTFFLTLCVLLLPSASWSQKASVARFPKIDQAKPSVYISYVKAGKRAPLFAEEGEEGIWLRLHNNTRWRISFTGGDVPKEYGDISLNYEIESERKDLPDVPIGYEPGHVTSRETLAPGASILFSVPREHIAQYLVIKVCFSFQWENASDVFADREAKHFVYFQSSNLPKRISTIQK